MFENLLKSQLVLPEPKNTKVVYTAIFGNNDKLKEPSLPIDGWDFICFTDNNKIKSPRWNIVVVEYRDDCLMDNRQKYKLFKMFPHLFLKSYDISLWVDASIQIYEEIDSLLRYLDASNVVFYRHILDFYQEADILKSRKYCAPYIEIINNQIERYRELELPLKSIYAASGIMLMKHNSEDVKNLMEEWWKEFLLFYSGRDQLPLGFVLWKTKCKVNFINGLYPRGNRKIHYFKMIGHERIRRRKNG